VYFWSSVTFKIKLGLILLAAINAFLLSQSVFRDARRGDAVRIETGIRLIAGSSLVFWLGAVVAGRLIAYLP
jgi:hypothetical protein